MVVGGCEGSGVSASAARLRLTHLRCGHTALHAAFFCEIRRHIIRINGAAGLGVTSKFTEMAPMPVPVEMPSGRCW